MIEFKRSALRWASPAERTEFGEVGNRMGERKMLNK